VPAASRAAGTRGASRCIRDIGRDKVETEPPVRKLGLLGTTVAPRGFESSRSRTPTGRGGPSPPLLVFTFPNGVICAIVEE